MLLSRLPFLGLGFGVEPDGWRTAANAARIAATGVYSASRLGANPVHEIGAALLFGGNVWWVTVAAALATSVAAGALALTIWRIRGEQSILLGLALGFVPVVFIASTGGKDYPWTLAFLALSTWTALEDRPVWSGAAFGLAVGCRLSVAPMGLIPLILLIGRSQPKRLRQAIKLIVTIAVTAGLAYLPVFYQYGFAFIGYTWTPPLTLKRFVVRGLLDVWGLVGLVSLGAAAASALWSRSTAVFPARSALPSAQWRWIAWSLGVAVPAALFMRFPSHAGYWIPAIPFVLLMAAERLRPRFAQVFGLALVLSPFVAGLQPIQTDESVEATWGIRTGPARLEPLRGPVLYDHARRRARLRIVHRAIQQMETLNVGTTVIVGPWRPMLTVLTPSQTLNRLRLQYLPNPAELTDSSTASYFGAPGCHSRLRSPGRGGPNHEDPTFALISVLN